MTEGLPSRAAARLNKPTEDQFNRYWRFKIHQAQVIVTVMDGEVVYERE
ncbi:MAG: hypothetical protein GY906_00365 [bacterium]|nr:hypothetical protein [bacterium]